MLGNLFYCAGLPVGGTGARQATGAVAAGQAGSRLARQGVTPIFHTSLHRAADLFACGPLTRIHYSHYHAI